MEPFLNVLQSHSSNVLVLSNVSVTKQPVIVECASRFHCHPTCFILYSMKLKG